MYHPVTTRRDVLRTIGACTLVAIEKSVCVPLWVLAQAVAPQRTPQPTPQYVSVLTHHNDRARTGANLSETVLNVANVSMRFGRLFERKVNGAVYAQPLVARVSVSNSMRNVLYIATMRNLVYAFDADSPDANAPLWGPVSVGPPVFLPDGNIGGGTSYKDIEWEVGILSTPVIDVDRNALYVVSATKEAVATRSERDVVVPPAELGVFRHRLHKLDLRTGALIGSSQPIAATIGNASLRSNKNNQRSGLALANGRAYVAFASYADVGPEYHGWIIAFDADTLMQREVFCATPMGNQGGIWMSGEAPAIDDAGNLYFMTGNGSFDGDTSSPATDFSTCFVKLTPSLQVASWFSPHNNADLGQGHGPQHDIDLGSAGVLLLPNTSRLVGGGKEGKFYLLEQGALGGFHAGSDSQIPQSFYVFHTSLFLTHHIHGCPTVWTGPMGMWVYVWPENDILRAYNFAGNRFTANAHGDVVPAAEGTIGMTLGMPGGFLSISANGAAAGSGILWANHPWREDTESEGIVEGVLRAYDASNLQEIWNSRTNRGRDDFGNFAKFCPPTIANGKVYLPTMGGLHRKVTIWGDFAREGPALANLDDNLLVLGWTGADNQLYVRWSADGVNWPDSWKATVASESSLHSSALAGCIDHNRLFRAWTDESGHLRVHSSYDRVNWFSRAILPETSDHGPALACGNGRLFLAWTDRNSKLNVMSSPNGQTWDPQHKETLNYTSPRAPGLAFLNGTLFLVWSGPDFSLNILQSSDGLTWGNHVSPPLNNGADGSDFAPGLALDGPTPTLCWRRWDYQQLCQMTPATDSVNNFDGERHFRGLKDTTVASPALMQFHGRVHVGWAGTDANRTLNVAVLSLGGVSAYGLLGV